MGLFGESVEELYAKATKCHHAQQYDEAIKLLNKAIKKEPNNTNLHNLLGLAFFRSGRHDEAFREYQTALKLNPKNGYARNNLSLFYAHNKMFDDAIREAKSVFETNCVDCFVDAHLTLSGSYISNGQYDDAILGCKEAMKLDPNNSDLHDTLGIAYYYKGLYEEAIAEYKEAIRLDPESLKLKDDLRMAEERLRAKLSSPQQNSQVIIQKEIIREIVKVPCQYCDTLVDVTLSKCPGCGAPFSIHQ